MDDNEKSFAERRGLQRTAFQKVIDEAQLLLLTPSDEAPPAAEVVNISTSGAGVLLPIQIDRGAQVRLRIQGRELPALDLEAEVRWISRSPLSTGKYPAGLKFLSLGEQRQDELRELVELMQKRRNRPE